MKFATPYSKSDNRIYKILDTVTLYNIGNEYYLVELCEGYIDIYTQFKCLIKKNKLKVFTSSDVNNFDKKLNKFNGDFTEGDFIKGKDRTYERSIYKFIEYVSIPHLKRMGILTEHLFFDDRKGCGKIAVSLDKYDLYSPTKEELKKMEIS
jgi:hypothetical protein